MTDTRKTETVRDIIAEMRREAPQICEYGYLCVGKYADRIEAAAKRNAAIHAMTCEANERLREHLEIALDGKQGNAAAMREALEDIRERLVASVHDGTIDPHEALGIVDAALAAPVRNCDVHRTAADAEAAFDRWCLKMLTGKCQQATCELPNHTGAGSCFAAWLFAKAEGGEE